jgi:hypothetical protein
MSKHHSIGNAAYAAQDYRAAKEAYGMGIADKSSVDEQTLIKLYLNRAQCSLKLQEYEDAINDCTSVIHLDEMNVKALVRRATSYEYIGELAKALQDAEKLMAMVETLGDELPTTYLPTIVQLHSRMRLSYKKDQEVCKREGRPQSLVTAQQTLRLFFIQPPPRQLQLGKVFDVRTSIGNEFCLWDTHNFDMDRDSDIEVMVSLVSVSNDESRSLDIQKRRPRQRIAIELASQEAKGRSPRIGKDGKAGLNLRFVRDAEVENDSNNSDDNDDKISDQFDEVVILKIELSSHLSSGARVVPILSLPIHVTALDTDRNHGDNVHKNASKQECEEFLTLASDVHPTCIREFRCVAKEDMSSSNMTCEDESLYVFESPGSLGIGGKVWDATFVLLDFFTDPAYRGMIENKRVLELGSGTGLSSLGLATLPHKPLHVTMTDLAPVVPLMNANITLNGHLVANCATAECIKSHYMAATFAWGTEERFWDTSSEKTYINDLNNGTGPLPFDVIVGSDLVYDPESFELLLRSIEWLFFYNNKNREYEGQGDVNPLHMVLVHRHRNPQDHLFFSKLQDIPGLHIADLHYRPSSHCTESEALRDVHVYHITRIK